MNIKITFITSAAVSIFRLLLLRRDLLKGKVFSGEIYQLNGE